MQITEKQKKQLIDLNDSRVNEILDLGLKVGEWYKDLTEKGLYYITKTEADRFYFYGLDVNGNWESKYWYFTKNFDLVKATHEEVEQALINEAKRRGFKEGVRVNREWRGFDIDIYINNNDFKFHDDNTLSLGSREIFKDGQWAEIIDDKAELKQEIKELEVRLKELRKKL